MGLGDEGDAVAGGRAGPEAAAAAGAADVEEPVRRGRAEAVGAVAEEGEDGDDDDRRREREEEDDGPERPRVRRGVARALEARRGADGRAGGVGEPSSADAGARRVRGVVSFFSATR